VELKRNETGSGIICWRLLIVPKWNWNKICCRQNQKRRLLLIVPKWNWNEVEVEKYNDKETSNRTKVELKLTNSEKLSDYYILLIVPKWNWNVFVFKNLNTDGTSNRTKVELKPHNGGKQKLANHASNRTKVELKPAKR